jgi:hypothetical protein
MYIYIYNSLAYINHVLYKCVFVHLRAYIHVQLCLYVYTVAYVCMSCMYVCVFICMYVYIFCSYGPFPITWIVFLQVVSIHFWVVALLC